MERNTLMRGRLDVELRSDNVVDGR
jgi:hypothetical protein